MGRGFLTFGRDHAARIPHRDNPGDPWTGEEWDRLYEPRHAHPTAPDLTVMDNPVTAELLGPKGEPIRQWRERPPFGYRSRR